MKLALYTETYMYTGLRGYNHNNNNVNDRTCVAVTLITAATIFGKQTRSIHRHPPGADVAVVHVGGDDDGDAGAAALAVQHGHVAGIGVEPGVDGLAHAA